MARLESSTAGRAATHPPSRTHQAPPFPASRHASKAKPRRPHPFKAAITSRLQSPLITLFLLWTRFLQLCFALASGISYALELSHGHSASPFIYSQVVFGLTLIILLLDATTARSYKLTFIIEWTICILWLALFGVFYVTYMGKNTDIEPDFTGVDSGRMKRAVWMNLVNFLLWMASAVFSTVMCCVGVKASVRWRINTWREKRKSKGSEQIDAVEKGVIREPPQARSEERLPLYSEVAVTVQ